MNITDLDLNLLRAFADQAGVGETPVLSWTPPSVGTPTGYLVEVFRLEAAGAGTTRTPVLRYATAHVTVILPPGLLEVWSRVSWPIALIVVGAVIVSAIPIFWLGMMLLLIFLGIFAAKTWNPNGADGLPHHPHAVHLMQPRPAQIHVARRGGRARQRLGQPGRVEIFSHHA